MAHKNPTHDKSYSNYVEAQCQREICLFRVVVSKNTDKNNRRCFGREAVQKNKKTKAVPSYFAQTKPVRW